MLRSSPRMRRRKILIQRRERLVEQQHPRIGDQCPGQRHALLLAARQFRRQAVGEVIEPAPWPATRAPAGALLATERRASSARSYVVEHAEMREQRVALEHHGRAAPHRRLVRRTDCRRCGCRLSSAFRVPRSCAESSSCRSRSAPAGSNRCHGECVRLRLSTAVVSPKRLVMRHKSISPFLVSGGHSGPARKSHPSSRAAGGGAG